MSDELAEVLKQDTILLWNKIGFDSYIWYKSNNLGNKLIQTIS